jgi:glycosyltransferase involved in cell wall biosynthesis
MSSDLECEGGAAPGYTNFGNTWRFASRRGAGCNAALWCNTFCQAPDQLVVTAHGIDHNAALFEILADGTHVILSTPWLVCESDVRRFAGMLPPHFDAATFLHVLCNTPEEVDAWRAVGPTPHVHLWSNACRLGGDFVRRPLRTRVSNPDRTYRAVCNSRLTKFKRQHLLCSVPDVAYVAASDKLALKPTCACPLHETCDACFHTAFTPEDLVRHPTSSVFVDCPEERVISILDDAEVGVVLSEVEGACYSSIEYLCRGLPVVSTVSRGGRDRFFTSENSITCEPHPAAVEAAVAEAVARLRSGAFDRKKIRANALHEVELLTKQFADVVQSIVGERCDVAARIEADRATFCNRHERGRAAVEKVILGLRCAVKDTYDNTRSPRSLSYDQLMLPYDGVRARIEVLRRRAFEVLRIDPDTDASRVLETPPDSATLDGFERLFHGSVNTEARETLERNITAYPIVDQIEWLVAHLGTEDMWGSQALLHSEVFGRNAVDPPSLNEDGHALVLAHDIVTGVGVAALAKPGFPYVFYSRSPLGAPLPRELAPELVLTLQRCPVSQRRCGRCQPPVPVPVDSAQHAVAILAEIEALPKIDQPKPAILAAIASRIVEVRDRARRRCYEAMGLKGPPDMDLLLEPRTSIKELVCAIETAVFGQTDTPCGQGLIQNMLSVPAYWQADYISRYYTQEWKGLRGVLMDGVTSTYMYKSWACDAQDETAVLRLGRFCHWDIGLKVVAPPDDVTVLRYPASSSSYSNGFFDEWLLVLGRTSNTDKFDTAFTNALPPGVDLLTYARAVTMDLRPWHGLDVGCIKATCTANFTRNFPELLETTGSIQAPPSVRSGADGVAEALPRPYPKAPFALKFAYPHEELASWGHRAGWAAVVHRMSRVSDPDATRPLLVLDLVEKTFSWDAKGDAPAFPIAEPFVGVWHNTPCMPKWFDFQHSPQSILARPFASDAIARHCRGVFVFSQYLARWLRDRIPAHVPIWCSSHPTDTDVARWSPAKFAANPNKCVVQVGYWLRRMTFIAKLKSGDYKKLWLYGNPWAFDCLQREVFHESVDGADFSDVAIAKLSNEAYDRVMTENIVVLDVYDSSVNNAVIEAVVRCTPILVNRHPAIVEYLGEDYPLYFTTMSEAESKLGDAALVVSAHEYLLDNEHLRTRLEYTTFIDDFVAALQTLTS